MGAAGVDAVLLEAGGVEAAVARAPAVLVQRELARDLQQLVIGDALLGIKLWDAGLFK
jgi:hypothetical protein